MVEVIGPSVGANFNSHSIDIIFTLSYNPLVKFAHLSIERGLAMYGSIRLKFNNVATWAFVLSIVLFLLRVVAIVLLGDFDPLSHLNSDVVLPQPLIQLFQWLAGVWANFPSISVSIVVAVSIVWGVLFFPFLPNWTRKFGMATLALVLAGFSALLPELLASYGLRPIDVIGTSVSVFAILLVWSLIRVLLGWIYKRFTQGNPHGPLELLARSSAVLAVVLFGLTALVVFHLGQQEYLLPGLFVVIAVLGISVVATNTRELKIEISSMRARIVFLSLLLLAVFLILSGEGVLHNAVTVFVVAMLLLVTRNMAFVAGKSLAVSSSTSPSTVSGGAPKMSSVKSAGFSLDSAVMGALYAPIRHRVLFIAIAAALVFIRGVSLGSEAVIILVLLAMAYVTPHVIWTALMVDGQSSKAEEWFYPWVHPILVVSATMYSLVAFAASQSVIGFVITMAIWMFLVAGEFAMVALLTRYSPMQVLRTLKAKPGAGSVATWSIVAAIVVAAGIVVAYFILAAMGFVAPALLVIAGAIFLLAVGILIAFWSEIAKKFAGGSKSRIVKPFAAYTQEEALLGVDIAWSNNNPPTKVSVYSSLNGYHCGTISVRMGQGGVELEIQDSNGTGETPGPITRQFVIVAPANADPSAGLLAWNNRINHQLIVGNLKVVVAMKRVLFSTGGPVAIIEAELTMQVTEEEASI